VGTPFARPNQEYYPVDNGSPSKRRVGVKNRHNTKQNKHCDDLPSIIKSKLGEMLLVISEEEQHIEL
jgi:hypothetical protein